MMALAVLNCCSKTHGTVIEGACMFEFAETLLYKLLKVVLRSSLKNPAEHVGGKIFFQ